MSTTLFRRTKLRLQFPYGCAVAVALGLGGGHVAAQTSAAQRFVSKAPVDWVRAAADKEVRIISDDGTFPVRYTMHRVDGKGSSVRAVIESRQGTVARTLYKDGHALTPEENALEHKRLQEILDDLDGWEKKQKRNSTARGYATSLVQLMPQAMLYTYAPAQPQIAASTPGPQVVLDFKPDPAFNPPTMASELLTGLEGRMWIDERTGVLVRVDARIIKPVNFGWGGIFAKFYPGGTVEFEQSPVGEGRWVYSRVDEKVSIRELMVHTREEHAQMELSELHLLAHPIDVVEAVHILMALPDPH